MFKMYFIPFFVILLLNQVQSNVLVDECNSEEPLNSQLGCFKQNHHKPIGILTTSSGIPIQKQDTSALNRNLFRSQFYLDSASHFTNELIPARVSHAHGSGAKGYFEVTDEFASVCGAKLFSAVGKKTPVHVRFSPMNLIEGTPETIRDKHGMAVQFDTEDGIFDLICMDAPVFAIKDPIHFPSLVHSAYRNPSTNLPDSTSFWDFTTNVPESIFSALMMFSDSNMPDGWQHMSGHAIHTYQVESADGKPHFVRFHLIPDAGVLNLNNTRANFLIGNDGSYMTRRLFNSISNKKYPSWTLYGQVLSLSDVQKDMTAIFDVTRKLPENEYPMRKIGKIVLNENPTNFFADVETSAFSAGNVVPKILGAPDKLFEARSFAYLKAQQYRLGSNYRLAPINRPSQITPLTYNRDGVSLSGNNMGSAPNYYPNSYSGPVASKNIETTTLIKIKEKNGPNNFDQVKNYIENELSPSQRTELFSNLAESLATAAEPVQLRALRRFRRISPVLFEGVKAAVTKLAAL